MANINNFSLVGVGSSVKLGKSGITLGQTGPKLTVGGDNVALESFVSGAILDLNLGTMSTETASDYSKTSAFASVAFSGSSSNVTEGTNLFYTDTRARSAISVTQNLIYDSGTGVITGPDLSSYLTAADISGKADVSYVDSTFLKLDGTSAMTSALAMGTHKITGLGAPSVDTDASTKKYVDDGLALKANSADLATVATSGLFGDLLSTPTTLSGYGITDAQPLDADLTAIAALTGTAGLLHTDGAGIWSVDNNTYLTTGLAASTYETITNVATGLATKLNLSGGTMTGPIAMGNHAITGLATPSADTDAATKGYVDTVAQGLHVHAPAEVATTDTLDVLSGGSVAYDNGTSGVGATLTVTGGSFTAIDGVTLTSGMRILVKDQADAKQNGVYTFTSSTVLTRATDFDQTVEVNGGDFLFVTAGTTYADTGWVQTTDATVFGIDAIGFAQFSAAGTMSVLAGTGIDVTQVGTEFTVALADTTVTPSSYGDASNVSTFTVDAQGRLTAAGTVAIAIDWAAITSGKPTTLAGYGITNGVSTTTNFGGDVSGAYNAITLANSGVTAITGTPAFVKFTVDAKGRVTSTTAVLDTDISTVLGYTPVNPVSLATVATSGLASDVSFAPAGDVAATDVQAAIAELDTEKLAKAGGTMSGDITMGGHTVTDLATPSAGSDAATKDYVDTAVLAAVAGGDFTAKVAFTDANGSTNILATIPTGAIVNRVTVKVSTAMTGGTAPTISVERGSQVIDNGDGSDLATTGMYVIDAFDIVSSGGTLTFTMTNGGGTGAAGMVFVEYSI